MSKKLGWKRWLRRLATISALVIVIGYVGLRIFLSSGWAADLVADQLQQIYGGKVTVDAVSIGVTGDTTIRGLELFERDPKKPAWLKIAGLKTDLNLFRLLFVGAMPTRVELDNVTALFQWDEKGELALQLPEPKEEKTEVKSLPRIEVRNSRIILRKHGQGEMVVSGISADLEEKNKQLKLNGDIADRIWGQWQATATISLDDERLIANLTTQRAVHLQTDELRKMPFVPDDIWKTIRLDAQATARIELRSDEKAFSYKIALDPSQTTLDFPSAGVRVEQIKGAVVIHDGTVELTDVRGDAYGGSVAVNGSVDHGGPDLRLRFTKLKVDRIDVRQFLKKWDMPDLFNGKLSAQADLTVTVKNDQLRIDGIGQGEVVGAKIADQPATVAFRLEKTEAETKSDRSVLNIHAKMSQVDLADTARRAKVDLPVPISGALSALFQANIPLSSLQDVKTIGATGVVEMHNVYIDQLAVPVAMAKLQFSDGIAEMKNLDVQLVEKTNAAIAQITGDARLPISPSGDLVVNIAAQDFTPPMLSPWVKTRMPVDGRVAAKLRASVAPDSIADPKAWQGSGTITAPKLNVEGLQVLDTNATIVLAKGLVSLRAFDASVAGGTLSASGKLSIDETLTFRGEAKLAKADLRKLQKIGNVEIPVLVDGTLIATANAKGTLSPLKWNLRGNAQMDNLKVDRVAIQKAEWDWAVDSNRVHVSNLTGIVHGGKISGFASIPLVNALRGSIQMQLKKLSATTLSKQMQSPIPVQGLVNAQLHGDISPSTQKNERDISLTFKLDSPLLRIQGVAVNELQGRAVYKNDSLDYQITAKPMGGDLDLQGRYEFSGAGKMMGQGSVAVANVPISQLYQSPELSELNGKLSLNAKYKFQDDTWIPAANGTASISGFRWYEKQLADRLQMKWNLDGTTLKLTSSGGRLSRGQLSAVASYDLENARKSKVIVKLSNAKLAPLLGPAHDVAGGTCSIDFRGNLGPTWSGTGRFTLSRGNVAGLDVQNVRLPYGLSYSPASGRGDLKITQGFAQAARGRIYGDVAVGFGPSLDLDGKLRLTGVSLESLFQQLFNTSGVGKGDIRGTVSFSGNTIRSADDLSASTLINFGNVQAFDFPVFRQIGLVVKAKQSLTFSSGKLDGKLNRGTIYVKQLSLESKVLKLFADGKMTLAGRLNLDVLAGTGEIAGGRRLRLLARAVPAIGPIPVGAIAQVTDILSNRAVHATVSGTTRSPIVRVRPLKTVGREAAKFFLNQAR